MIGYTNKQMETEFNDPQLNPVVRMIVLATAAYVFQKYGEVIWLTSIFRPISSNLTDTKSTHNFWRAVDADKDAG